MYVSGREEILLTLQCSLKLATYRYFLLFYPIAEQTEDSKGKKREALVHQTKIVKGSFMFCRQNFKVHFIWEICFLFFKIS